MTLRGVNYLDWAITAVVWLVWAAMLALALWLVWTYSSTVPIHDDWYYVPALAGVQKFTFNWLLEPFYDHKLLLTRIVVFTQVYAAGDFRASMYCSVIAMAVLAAGMIVTARRVRGRQSLADVFWALSLLGVGQFDPFLQAMPHGHIVTTVLGSTLLLLIVRNKGVWSRTDLLLGGLTLLSLAVICASGMPYVPALSVLFGVLVFLRVRTGQWADLWLLLPPLLASGYVLHYFAGYERPAAFPQDVGLMSKVRTAISFAGMGLGLGIWELRSRFNVAPYGHGVPVVVLLALSVLGMAWTWYTRPAERVRSLGMFMYLGAMATLIAGLAWGRGAYTLDAYASHYVTVAQPILCCIFFVAVIVLPRVGWVIQGALALTLVVLFQQNFIHGEWGALDYRGKARAIEEAIRTHGTATRVVETFGERPFPFETDPQGFVDHLTMLSRAGIGVFAELLDESDPGEVAVARVPIATHDLEWKDGIARITGPDPTLDFSVGTGRQVRGLRLSFHYKPAPQGKALLTAVWWRLGGPDGVEGMAGGPREFAAPRGRAHLTIPVNDIIEYIRIAPDPRVKEFRLDAIRLLVPE